MKNYMIAAALAMAVFAAPAKAGDWNNATDGYQYGNDYPRYAAVDGNGNYVPVNQVNEDGTFKATCNDCSWKPVGATTPLPTNTARYRTRKESASNPANGTRTEISADGVKTNGEVEIKGVGVGAKLGEHDGRLNNHAVHLANHGGRIGNLEADNANQWSHIRANSEMLKQHGEHLDTIDKGLAITAALPDAWLGDSKHFGVFASVGGFNDETAFGFAAIGRINQTFSINTKLGTDTSFEEFAWQLGAGAQW